MKILPNVVGEMQLGEETVGGGGETVAWLSVWTRQEGSEQFEVKGVSSCYSLTLF